MQGTPCGEGGSEGHQRGGKGRWLLKGIDKPAVEPCWGTLGNDVEHTLQLCHLKVRELGHSDTNSRESRLRAAVGRSDS